MSSFFSKKTKVLAERKKTKKYIIHSREIENTAELLSGIVWDQNPENYTHISESSPLHILQETAELIRDDIRYLHENSDEQYRRQTELLESLQTGIYIVDSETREILYVNSYLSNLLKIPGEQIEGNTCDSILCGNSGRTAR